jgi:hypothetical protein
VPQKVLPSCITGIAPKLSGDNFKRQLAGKSRYSAMQHFRIP